MKIDAKPCRSMAARMTIILAVLVLPSCSSSSLKLLSGTTPAFEPIDFFTGHVRSWGVLENRYGEPTTEIRTDCEGTRDHDGLVMVQRLTEGSEAQVRLWHMRRVGADRYEATANDILGVAKGETSGRAFHLHYALELSPGNPLEDVSMDQWMYGMADGSMVNRATISKLGVILAEATEHFVRAP